MFKYFHFFFQFLSGTPLTCNGHKEKVTWVWKSASNLESEFVLDTPAIVDRLELTGNEHT